MSISLSSLKSTKKQAQERAPIVTIYGVDGVGKTTLASEWPSPVYIPTSGERAPSDIDLPTPGTVESVDNLYDIIGELLDRDDEGALKHEFRTAIFDSLDGLEPLIHKVTCARIGATSIDDSSSGSTAAYGRGFREADVEWTEFTDALDALAVAGINVVLLAHPGIVTFNSPVSDPYSRYEVKLQKRGAALIREKSDLVGFVNYRVTLVKADPKNPKSHTHGEGKERLIHLAENAGFVAKSRFPTPESIKYVKGKGYSELAKYLPSTAEAA
jgi:hypothetical protein